MQKKDSIIDILRKFTTEDVPYQLYKLASSRSSSVPRGATQIGDVELLEEPNHPNEVMVLVGRGFVNILKTSPVKKITKQTEKYIEFITESKSEYRLSK